MTIEPLSSVPASAVRSFLSAHQHEPEIIDWKYFDQEFNQGRERGLVAMSGEQVVSFIGLIPFTVTHKGIRENAAWSCDWHRDPGASGPLGLMLLRQTVSAYPFIYSSGGSQMTHAIMARLCRLTFLEHGIELYKPLRLGGAIHLWNKASKFSLPSIPAPISRLPLRLRRAQLKPTNLELFQGIPDGLADLLQSEAGQGISSSSYTLEDLRWRFERCPILDAQTCTLTQDGVLLGAILAWRLKSDRRLWRLATILRNADDEALAEGLDFTLAHIRAAGGWLASLLTSRLDDQALRVTRRLQFYPSNRRRPLYILSRSPEETRPELETLSYLDTDYAYRFSPIRA